MANAPKTNHWISNLGILNLVPGPDDSLMEMVGFVHACETSIQSPPELRQIVEDLDTATRTMRLSTKKLGAKQSDALRTITPTRRRLVEPILCYTARVTPAHS